VVSNRLNTPRDRLDTRDRPTSRRKERQLEESLGLWSEYGSGTYGAVASMHSVSSGFHVVCFFHRTSGAAHQVGWALRKGCFSSHLNSQAKYGAPSFVRFGLSGLADVTNVLCGADRGRASGFLRTDSGSIDETPVFGPRCPVRFLCPMPV